MPREGTELRVGEDTDVGGLVDAMAPEVLCRSCVVSGVESPATRLRSQKRTQQDDPTAMYLDDLPWADFAEAWSEAEARLASLERDLSGHELRPYWICRTDLQTSAAVASLRGGPVAMDDLALVDAGRLPRWRPTSWIMGKALLSLRRHIGRAGPAKVLTIHGILDLEARLGAKLNEVPMVGKSVSSASQPGAVEQWLSVAERLVSCSPPLLAAAMALRAWRCIAPLATGVDEIGLLLSSTLLWRWGKIKSLSVCPLVGMQSAAVMYSCSTPGGGEALGSWIAQYCRVIETSAALGLVNLEQMELAISRAAELEKGHRSNSRIPRLIRLFLAYPVMTNRFISHRLNTSAQGTDWMLKELVAKGVVLEATGRAKNRAYRLA